MTLFSIQHWYETFISFVPNDCNWFKKYCWQEKITQKDSLGDRDEIFLCHEIKKNYRKRKIQNLSEFNSIKTKVKKTNLVIIIIVKMERKHLKINKQHIYIMSNGRLISMFNVATKYFKAALLIKLSFTSFYSFNKSLIFIKIIMF